jgi:hypothetical protein
MSPASRTVRVSVSPTFKMVFLGVLAVTVLSMLLGCSLAMVAMGGQANDQIKILVELFASITKMGFGAFLGLLGGLTLGNRGETPGG